MFKRKEHHIVSIIKKGEWKHANYVEAVYNVIRKETNETIDVHDELVYTSYTFKATNTSWEKIEKEINEMEKEMGLTVLIMV